MKTTEIKVAGYENYVTPTKLRVKNITAEVDEHITAVVSITTGLLKSYTVTILVDGKKAASIYGDENSTVYEARKMISRHVDKGFYASQLSRNGNIRSDYSTAKVKEYKSAGKAYIAALAENGLTYEDIIEISNAMIEKMIEIREESAEEISTTDVEDDGSNEDTDDGNALEFVANLDTSIDEDGNGDDELIDPPAEVTEVQAAEQTESAEDISVKIDELADEICENDAEIETLTKELEDIEYRRREIYFNYGKPYFDESLMGDYTEYNEALEELDYWAWEIKVRIERLENRNEELQTDKDKLEGEYWEKLAIAPEVKVPEPVFALQAFGEGKAKFEVGKVYFSREVYTNKPEHYFKILKVNKGYITYYDDIEGRKIRLKIYDADTGNEYFCYDKYWHSCVYVYDCCKVAAAFGFDGINGECDYKDFETTTDAYNWLWKKAAGRQNFALEITVDGKRVYFYDASAENRSLEIHDDEIQKLHDEKQRCNNLHEFDGTILDTTDNDVDKLDGEIAELQNKINNTLNTCRKLAEDKLKSVIDGANDEILIQVKFFGENFNSKLRRNDKAEIEILGNGEIFALDATGFYASYGSFKAFMAAVNGLADAIKRGDKEYIFPENK